MYVPDAAQYAGNEETPAALAGVGKDGALVIKCYRKDKFASTPYKDKANKKATQEQLPDPSKGKGKGNVTATPSVDADIPF